MICFEILLTTKLEKCCLVNLLKTLFIITHALMRSN